MQPLRDGKGGLASRDLDGIAKFGNFEAIIVK